MAKLRKRYAVPKATRITNLLISTLIALSCFVPVLVNPGAAYADDIFTKLPNQPDILPTGWGQC